MVVQQFIVQLYVELADILSPRTEFPHEFPELVRNLHVPWRINLAVVSPHAARPGTVIITGTILSVSEIKPMACTVQNDRCGHREMVCGT